MYFNITMSRRPPHSKLKRALVFFSRRRAEVQHGIARRVFANAAHAHRFGGLPVRLHGNTAVAGRHVRAQERRPLRPVHAGHAVRRAAGLPAGRGQAAAQGAVRRRDRVRPAERLLVPDILPRVHTEVRRVTLLLRVRYPLTRLFVYYFFESYFC